MCFKRTKREIYHKHQETRSWQGYEPSWTWEI